MAQLGYYAEKLPRKLTSFWHVDCKKTLGTEPYFKICQTNADYKNSLLQNITYVTYESIPL